MKKITLLLITVILVLSFQHSNSMPVKKPTGYKSFESSNNISYNNNFLTSYSISDHSSSQGTISYFRFQKLGINTYYDIQSNAVPNQIWQDPLLPDNVHAVFMYSNDTSFTKRGCAYLFSNDRGSSWIFLGDVPSTNRSGFPSITGLTNGAAVIANNVNFGANTRAIINYDTGPGFGVFTELNPGDNPAGLFPRVVGIGSDKLAFVTSMYSNTANISTGTFSGYQPYPGSDAETYWISIAPNGRLGHAFIGASNGVDDNDVFYRFSDDDGFTWSNPLMIWDWNMATDSLGCLRGISMVFDNENEPHVAFNISKLTSIEFFPQLPSSIRIWSPVVNSGIPVIVADQNNVPFYPNIIAPDAYLPICRPAIGRGSDGSRLFLTFPATSGNYGADSNSYYALWFTESNNNGVNWFNLRKLTPETPLLDWRYVSVSQVNHSNNSKTYAQMIAQGDSIPGSFVNGAPIGKAEAYSITYILEVGITNISNNIPDKFSLAQNFPNPFNPETKIRFDIKENSKVTLKVYDLKGSVVSVLADDVSITPGTKEVTFTANGLSSGVYFYTLSSKNFSETKKMLLIR